MAIIKLSVVIVCAAVVSGCTAPNLVGMRGNNLNTSYGLQDRRLAKQHVKAVAALPNGADAMGDFSVERCHQYAQNEAPTDAVLADDLLLLAYAEGADGLTNLRFSRESGLLKNCWSIAKGTAMFFKASK